jgi:hypothetical protein
MLRARVQMHLDVPTMGPHPLVEALRQCDGDDVVGFPVKYQDGWELWNLVFRGIRVAPATVEIHHGFD